ncbi:conserved hypothetical protein [uncultured Alphaproteobacteria bacterium]|uniref:DAGKc domain-containing protein n=1 Tax=uncultured Alphaproteobacteria bacterium TaxID=91750 RepID=A0A212KL71_9PROT|nr:conserved hypothetical protein [uncultured Alphaproteobacteria bacterium]
MIVIFNPTAGPRRGALLGRVLARLHALGAAVDLRPTACAGDAVRIAAALDPPADGLVVAAGGDGTLAEVAEGVLRNPAAARLRLGVIPLGTANVLAHEIGLPRRPATIVRTLLAGRAQPLHAGRIRAADGAERAFLMMAGAGFDAAVVAAVTPGLKRRCGKGAYLWHTLRLAAVGRFPAVDLRIDGEPYRAASVVVCNGRHYGGPYRLAPAADLSRPEFEVVLLDAAGGARVFSQGLRLMLGVLHRAPGVRTLTAREVEISGVGPLQADGDLAARLPVRIAATGEFLRLMTP